MRPKSIGALFTAALLFLCSVAVWAEPKGETVTVKGEVVDLLCYLEGGDHGFEDKQCGIACSAAGNPIGLLTVNGEIDVMMGIKHHKRSRDLLIGKMAETVSVEGTLAKKGGIQVIQVSSVR